MDILITESQYKSILLDEKRRIATNMFKNLSEDEQTVVIEMFKVIYHDKLINEAWWNTVGDFLGWADPSGVIDLINGLDYIRQGEYFFGFLSLVSVIPLADFMTKPLIGLTKFSKSRRSIDSALKIAKNAKTAEDMASAQRVLSDAANSNAYLKKLMINSDKWGVKLKNALDAIPDTFITTGLKRTINNWIDLFSHSLTKKANVKLAIGNLAKNVKTDPATAAKLVNDLKSLKTTASKGTLSTFQVKDPNFMITWFWPGLNLRTKEHRQLIGMMRQTKFYAGLLDHMGVANFVGPEELINKEGEEIVENQIKEYANTPQGQQYWSEDLSSVGPEQPAPAALIPTKSTTPVDPIDAFFDELLTL